MHLTEADLREIAETVRALMWQWYALTVAETDFPVPTRVALCSRPHVGDVLAWPAWGGFRLRVTGIAYQIAQDRETDLGITAEVIP